MARYILQKNETFDLDPTQWRRVLTHKCSKHLATHLHNIMEHCDQEGGQCLRGTGNNTGIIVTTFPDGSQVAYRVRQNPLKEVMKA